MGRSPIMKILRDILLATLLLILPGTVAGSEARRVVSAPPEALAIVARTSPWPVNSAPIGYRGAIWFTNSVKGVNHNAADIWRYDPVTGQSRYERGLFSQDTGAPVIHRGLLYWPFEDGRAGSLGVAAVTDGAGWQEVLIPGFRAFHLHALANWQGGLVAVTAAINAGLQLSQDGGRTWQTLVDLAPRVGRFVRFDAVVAAGDRLYLRLDEADGTSLVTYHDGALAPLPGWAKARWLADPVVVGTGVAALTWGTDAPITLFDGQRTRGIDAPEPGAELHALFSDGADLFAAGVIGGSGVVWRRSAEDGTWARHALFSGGRPQDMTLYQGQIYVTGAGDDGRGVLWGPAPGQTTMPGPTPPAPPLPRQFPGPPVATDWPALAAQLETLLQTLESYENHGRTIQAALLDAARRNPPTGLLPGLLSVPFPPGTVPTYGGRGQAVRADIARWYILWAIGLTREPAVPVDILQAAWTRAPNSPEKWFDPLLIGLWAAGNAGQADRATLGTLIDRLERDDPLWLLGQVVATLRAITGCGFGHDGAGWRAWWQGGGATCAQPR